MNKYYLSHFLVLVKVEVALVKVEDDFLMGSPFKLVICIKSHHKIGEILKYYSLTTGMKYTTKYRRFWDFVLRIEGLRVIEPNKSKKGWNGC